MRSRRRGRKVVRSGVDAVELANYPPRCGAGSSGCGKSPDDIEPSRAAGSAPSIAGRVLHSALTSSKSRERFTAVLARG